MQIYQLFLVYPNNDPKILEKKFFYNRKYKNYFFYLPKSLRIGQWGG